jgi:hypothetical protein
MKIVVSDCVFEMDANMELVSIALFIL